MTITFIKKLDPTHQKILTKRLNEFIELEKRGKEIAHRLIRKHDNRIKLVKEILKNQRPIEHFQIILKADRKTTSG